MLPKENLLNSSVLFAGCYGGIQRRHIFSRCSRFSGKDRNRQVITVLRKTLNAMLRLLNLILWAIEGTYKVRWVLDQRKIQGAMGVQRLEWLTLAGGESGKLNGIDYIWAGPSRVGQICTQGEWVQKYRLSLDKETQSRPAQCLSYNEACSMFSKR